LKSATVTLESVHWKVTLEDAKLIRMAIVLYRLMTSAVWTEDCQAIIAIITKTLVLVLKSVWQTLMGFVPWMFL
jgi:hypothetical protein